jgi:hypothetical protein
MLSTTQGSTRNKRGEVVPPLKKIEEKINKSLRLWNWPWPRSIAVKGIALALRRWALEDGLEVAARRGAVLLEQPEPLKWGGTAPLCGLPPAEILTAEKFADMLGGLTDELEGTKRMRSDDDNSGRDQRLLPGDRTTPEGSGAGSDPGTDRPDREHGEAGLHEPGEGGRVLDFPQGRRGRDGTREGLSRREVVTELKESRLDLQAFQDAYSAVHRRVQDVKDEGRMLRLVEWSGTSAVMGSLELSIHAMERAIDELRDILQRIDRGVIPNLDEEDHG